MLKQFWYWTALILSNLISSVRRNISNFDTDMYNK